MCRGEVVEMKKEYLQPFLEASQHVSEKFFSEQIEKSEISLDKSLAIDCDVIVALGIKGDLSGVVLFGLSKKGYESLSTYVLEKQGITKEMAINQMNMTEQGWEELKKDTIKEFGNQVVGYATKLYEVEGFTTDITTPSFIEKEQLTNFNKESIRFEMTNKLANMIVKLHIQKG